MSHFTRVSTRLRDPQLLVEALAAVGYPQVEVHEAAQPLYGYQGDPRPERAEIVVRREHIGQASNDIGFAGRPDGSFEAVISSFDRGRHGEAWLSELTQAYGRAATLRYAEAHGFEVDTDQLEENGTRRLVLRRVG